MGPGNYVSELEEDQDDCSDDCFETDVSGNRFVSLYHLTVEKYSCITSCLGGERRTSFCRISLKKFTLLSQTSRVHIRTQGR